VKTATSLTIKKKIRASLNLEKNGFKPLYKGFLTKKHGERKKAFAKF